MGEANHRNSVHVVAHKPSSPTLSNFTVSKLLPTTISFMADAEYSPPVSQQERRTDSSRDEQAGYYEHKEEPPIDYEARKRFSTDALSSYDLAPPPPTVSHTNAEYLATRLFSADHLNCILREPFTSYRFTSFLNRYRPNTAPTLVRHLEAQKALTAIRYANLLACQMSSQRHSRRSSTSSSAAIVDSKFELLSRRAIDELISDALPSYITYRMVTLVTECLVKEITGSNTPLMKELVEGLAEVYCMTDPSLPDNPIVFASQEFYNTTQYGREYVIGKNCRFLQGPRTSREAVKRISDALKNSQEICEVLLNYKRDGTPFINLVMMAPLMDHLGNVRYFIGCQIDISHLIEGGRGLESFRSLLDSATEKPLPDPLDNKPSLRMLRELGDLLNDDEVEIVATRSRRRGSMDSGKSSSTSGPSNKKEHVQRRYVGMEESNDADLWPPTQFGPSGRLPGVYQNYILVRPYPSLRIIFTSSALRIPGLSQSRLMDRIGGPQHVREGLLDALSQGIGVTAKVSWLTQSVKGRTHTPSNTNSENSTFADEHHEGKPRWIHCTPLMGSDTKIGVIMIVMVDKEEITGTLNHSHFTSPVPIRTRDSPHNEDWPMRGTGLNVSGNRYTSSKLYAEYLRREGSEPKDAAMHEPEASEGRERARFSDENAGQMGRTSSASRGSREEGTPVVREGAARSVSVRRVNGSGHERA